ncbi:MAG TPA: M28 family peptidase [Bryobacteraceae bacterium]|nr:M28 family peptidase [Bryobacteraceae bacterium]
MHREKALILLMAVCLPGGAWSADHAARKAKTPVLHSFSGAQALEYTRKAVSFGPRPPGSPAIRQLQTYILAQLKQRGCEVMSDDFTAQTPAGPVGMKNIIARFAGRSGRAIVFSGHYDTKSMPGATFVGADDGGSSAGFLLEIAAALEGRPRRDDVYLVWFDGEEAFRRQWAGTDNLYGSRHLAERWATDGTLSRIKALINVDMIGDKDLDIMPEMNSSAALRKLVWDTAARLGYGKYFLEQGGPTEDDHMPFLQAGVNALDLIDFDKPYWHTPDDTMDKLSAHSFEVVGTVLLEVLQELEG